MKKTFKHVFIILTALALSLTSTMQTFAQEEKIDASNYTENRERLERQANSGNVINETTSQDYTFGTYGRVHIDGWNVQILSTKIGADGYHTITFSADEYYVLPAQSENGKSRFASVQDYSTTGATSYTVDTNKEIGTLRFKPSTSKDVYNATPILVRLVGIDGQSQESLWRNKYVFIEVSHKGIGFMGNEQASGLSFQLDGSKTYLVKANTPLKVYTTVNPGFKPIETSNQTSGVQDGSTDFSNRYFVISGSNRDRIGDMISYDTTLLNVNIYNAYTRQWEKISTLDFYHDDNTISMPDINDSRLAINGYRITGFNIQQLTYPATMALSSTWSVSDIGIKDTITLNASDYNQQWVSTGTDGGYDQYRISSLRHRAGNIFIQPIYVQQFTVRFLDFDGQLISAQTIDKNANATAPVDLLRDGYIFTGWDKDFTNVQGNLDVYATYEKEAPTKVNVTFMDEDGSVLKVDTIDKGTNATAPTKPSKEGYRFTGWDKDFTNVQRDLMVKATYEKLETPTTQLFTVTFVDYDGNLLNAQEVEQGKDAIAPANPQRDGYTFIGWDKDFKNIQGNLVVMAQYEINTVVVPTPPVTPDLPNTPDTPVVPETPVLPVTPTPVETVEPTITITDNPTADAPALTPVTSEVTDNTVNIEAEAVEIADNVTPLANNDTVEIDEQDVPLANNKVIGSWALVNLIATILTTIVGLLLVLSKHSKEKDNEEKDASNEDLVTYTRRRWTKIVSVVIAIVSIVIFFLTENITLPMRYVDKWTIGMLLILLAQLVIFLIVRRHKENHKQQVQQVQN